MYNETTRAKLEFSLMMIEDIELIVERHGGIDNAVNDVEGYHALLMCIQQIGESISKIKEEPVKSRLPVDAAYKMRNIIAHDYPSVSLNIVLDTLKIDIPELKNIIIDLMENSAG